MKKRMLIPMIFLTIILSCFTVVGVFASDNSPKLDIPRLYVDFRSKEAFSEVAEFYIHTPSKGEPDPNTGGVYEFSGERGAINVKYAPTDKKPPYRVFFRFPRMNADYKYAVIVYSAASVKPYKISLWNSPMQGKEAVLVNEGIDTDGQWLISSPVEIDTSVTPNIISRWCDGNLNNLYIYCEDENAEFYIKELTFFKSEEDAKAYYSFNKASAPPGEPLRLDSVFSPIELIPEAGKSLLSYNGAEPSAPYSLEMTPAAPELSWAVNVRTVYKTNEPYAHELWLNVGDERIRLVNDTSVSCGNTVVSDAVNLTDAAAKALGAGEKLAVTFSSTVQDAVIEVEKLVFSFSEEQAYKHFGDTRKAAVGAVINFGPEGSAKFYGNGTSDDYGRHTYDEDADSLKITYCQAKFKENHYMAMAGFAVPSSYNTDCSYIRVAYKAKTSSSDVPMVLYNNKTGIGVPLGVTGATEDFVLTDTVRITDDMAVRYANGLHCTLTFDDKATDSAYYVKGIFFFDTKKNADMFTLADVDGTIKDSAAYVPITLMGHDISEYRVVIPEDAGKTLTDAAAKLVSGIAAKSGTALPVVYDSEPAEELEIIIGNTSREQSIMSELSSVTASTDGSRLVFKAAADADIADLVDRYLSLFFEFGKSSADAIALDKRAALRMDSFMRFTRYDAAEAIESRRVTYTFNTEDDLAYWDHSDGWGQIGKVYSCNAGEMKITESRLYDSDVSLDLTFVHSNASDDSSFGVMLRRSGDGSYVKLAYSPMTHSLTAYVKYSYSCLEVPVAKTGLLLAEGLEYRMKIELKGEKLSVAIGSHTVLMCDGIALTSPGKVALFADGVDASVGNLEAVLHTVDGRILGEAVFNETVLMRRGGDSNYRIPSIITTNAGTLIAAANDRRETLADNAPVQWLVIRRKPAGGEWEELRVIASDTDTSYAIGTAVYDDVNDVIFVLFNCNTSNQTVIDRLGASRTPMIAVSRDDGITWEVRKNTVFPNEHGLTGHAHGADSGFTVKYGEHAGRLITSARTAFNYSEAGDVLRTQHYNCTLYSDDGGLTWQTGGLVQPGTGEGALTERTDGTLVLNSRAYFNDHMRRVAYSTDGGKSFGGFENSRELLEAQFGVNASIICEETKGGQILTLFSNPYPDETMLGTSARRNMTVCLSYDEGRSWVTHRTAHAAFSAYSCLTYNPVTDTFFLLYESGPDNSHSHDNISVIEFNLEWLLDD